jgi:RNA polymerase sigma-70 factor (ECF subfamily)
MGGPGSVTRWLDQLRSDDPGTHNAAARQIWQRYACRLLQLARGHLNERIRQREDEQDVLQSMYKSFCLRQRRGAFDLGGRDELWQVLVTITLRKAHNVAKRHGRDRRDYRRDRADPAARAGASPSWHDLLAHMEAAGPTPEDAAVLGEALRRRLDVLPEPLRRIALWKLEGYTNEEIAAAPLLNCATRTVERKLEMIRRKWEALADGDAAAERTSE